MLGKEGTRLLSREGGGPPAANVDLHWGLMSLVHRATQRQRREPIFVQCQLVHG